MPSYSRNHAAQYLHMLNQGWDVFDAAFRQQQTAELETFTAQRDKRIYKPYELIHEKLAKHTSVSTRAHAIDCHLDAQVVDTSRNPDVVHVYTLFHEAWVKFKTAVEKARRITFFAPNEALVDNFTTNYFRSLQLSQLRNIWITHHCDGQGGVRRDDVLVLFDLCDYLKDHPPAPRRPEVPITNTSSVGDIPTQVDGASYALQRRRARDDELTSHEVQKECDKLTSVNACMTKMRTQWQLLVKWCGHGVGTMQTLRSLYSVVDALGKAKARLCRVVQELRMDPVSLEYTYESTYEDTCHLISKRVLTEWLQHLQTRQGDTQAAVAYLGEMLTLIGHSEQESNAVHALLVMPTASSTTTSSTTSSKSTAAAPVDTLYDKSVVYMMEVHCAKNDVYLASNLSDVLATVEQCANNVHLSRELTDPLLLVRAALRTSVAHYMQRQRQQLQQQQQAAPQSEEFNSAVRFNEVRRAIDRMCSMSDAARYFRSLVTSAQQLLKDHPTTWYERLLPLITGEIERMPLTSYMPDVHRVAFKRNKDVLQQAAAAVKQRNAKAVSLVIEHIENAFTAKLDTAHKAVLQKRSDLLVDETMFPTPMHLFSSSSSSSSTPTQGVDPVGGLKVNREHTQELQRQSAEACKFAYAILDKVGMSTMQANMEMRLKSLAFMAKEYIESRDCTLATTWEGVQSVALLLCEVYVLSE